MSVDLSEFYSQRDRRCIVARAFERLSEEDGVKLQAALNQPGISQSEIARWLSKRGISMGQSTVGAHRSGRCGCSRG